MTIIRFYSKLLLILICALPCFAHAHFTVTPVKLKFDNGAQVASLTIKNESDESNDFQLTVYKVTKESHNQEIVTETKDLLATPAMFKLKAKGTQLIRVALKKDVMYSNSGTYQLAVRQLPHKVTGQVGHAVHFLTEFRVPVTIEHAVVGKNASETAKAK